MESSAINGQRKTALDWLAGRAVCDETGVSLMEWKDQYKHPQWQKKRLEALENAEYMCERCFDSESQLHVHHKRYVKGRMIWDYELEELSVLCGDCHEISHIEKDVFSHMLAHMHASALDEIIPLVAGYCSQILGPSRSDMTGPISYVGERCEVVAGAIAAELCNRIGQIGEGDLRVLLGMLEAARKAGKKVLFSIDDNNGEDE